MDTMNTMDTMMDERAQMRTAAATTATIERILSQISQAARAEAIFGQPVERGDYTVIPCAKVSVGLGLGSGSGSSPMTKGEQGKAQGQGQGEGAGGGGGANGRPMAVIVVSRTGVRVQPIVDVTRVIVASLVTAGLMALTIAQVGASQRHAAALSAFAFGRMRPFGRGGAAIRFPFPMIKLPSATQRRRALKR
jgi:uncharacterized spore protein YtfJ